MEVCRKTANGLDGTELRLGLPGGGLEGDVVKNSAANGKRGFEEIVDLKLKLSPKGTCTNYMDQSDEKVVKISPKDKKFRPCSNDPPKPPSKYIRSIFSSFFFLFWFLLLNLVLVNSFGLG